MFCVIVQYLVTTKLMVSIFVNIGTKGIGALYLGNLE
ncbi:hypothetical protein NSTC745_02512 [Nostoc sp. DSM 114161]|jgi:hypothetical protein